MIFRRLRVPLDIHSGSDDGPGSGSEARRSSESGSWTWGFRIAATIRRRGGSSLCPVVSQSVVTWVSSAIWEISSTRNFLVPVKDLESLEGSIPMLRATSLCLIPAVLMASRTRVSSDFALVTASLLVATTHTVCTHVAILAILNEVLSSLLPSVGMEPVIPWCRSHLDALSTAHNERLSCLGRVIPLGVNVFVFAHYHCPSRSRRWLFQKRRLGSQLMNL